MKKSKSKKITVAQAFNEWMRRYIEDPKQFEAEFQAVGRFLKQKARGCKPSYGDQCAAYLAKLQAGDRTEKRG